MRILVHLTGRNNGMYYHRIYTPFKRMMETIGVEVEETPIEEGKDGKNKTVKVRSIDREYLNKFDAVFFSRQIDIDGSTKETIDFLKEQGKKIVFDIDDYWELDKTHVMYSQYKKDRIKEQTIEAIKYSDIVFTPTPYLTEECKKHNPNSYTIKTAIDTTHSQWSSPTITSDLTRFGWIGGIHHRQDVAILYNSINEVHKNLTGYQFCLGGFSCEKVDHTWKKGNKIYNGQVLTNSYYYELEKLFTNNYKVIDEDYKKYLDMFSRTLPDHQSYFKPYRRLWTQLIENYGKLYDEIDISLVPLSNLGVFNQYKSELKLIEAGTKGKMAIVSKVKPYTLVPDECVHFIDKSDMGGWYHAIKYCLDNPAYVKEKAQALSEYIKKNYDLDKENEKRFNLIKSIL